MFNGLCTKKSLNFASVFLLFSLSLATVAHTMEENVPDKGSPHLKKKEKEKIEEWREELREVQKEIGINTAYNESLNFYNDEQFAEAVEHSRHALEGGHPQAESIYVHALYHLGEGFYMKGEFFKAGDYFEKANKSNPPPYLKKNILINLKQIGMLYYTTAKFPEAYKALIQVAENPLPTTSSTQFPILNKTISAAQFTLGCMCYEGKGLVQSTPAALEWFNKAKANGHQNAQEKIDEILAANLPQK